MRWASVPVIAAAHAGVCYAIVLAQQISAVRQTRRYGWQQTLGRREISDRT